MGLLTAFRFVKFSSTTHLFPLHIVRFEEIHSARDHLWEERLLGFLRNDAWDLSLDKWGPSLIRFERSLLIRLYSVMVHLAHEIVLNHVLVLVLGCNMLFKFRLRHRRPCRNYVRILLLVAVHLHSWAAPHIFIIMHRLVLRVRQFQWQRWLWDLFGLDWSLLSLMQCIHYSFNPVVGDCITLPCMALDGDKSCL